MAGPLVANPNPLNFPAGPLGPVYFNGAISGMGLFQSSPETYLGDHGADFDISNGLVSLQNTSGWFQFFVQAGIYSFPALGTAYLHADRTTGDFFGPVPVAYGKLVPNDTFSVEVGKLPTLIGAEYGFTFQNMNIERGLLWGQEPIVSRGIQGNYTYGPVAFSLSLNDGFYSGDYDWLSGSATWTIDKLNTLELVAGGNFSRSSVARFTSTPPFAAITPPAQDNSTILNLIYTYSNAPWTITPYFQYTHVPSSASLGLADSDTYGAAILASYQINDNWSLAGRAEIIGSSGGTNLLGYGPGSGAFSFTLTPGWQRGIFFARADASVVSAWGTTPGDVFGSSGTTKTQGRLVLEGGIIF
ncbi:MAG TPA: outer membrane beta-barrel protein [Stellaceae bacterium]|nr:outer membrane beta-barrel protein [Stellaceae bacterium]